MLDPVNVAWTLAGNILAPIFRGGALSAAVDVTDADVEAAVALYGDTAVTAFTESTEVFEVCDEDGNRYPSESDAEAAGLDRAEYRATFCEYAE